MISDTQKKDLLLIGAIAISSFIVAESIGFFEESCGESFRKAASGAILMQLAVVSLLSWDTTGRLTYLKFTVTTAISFLLVFGAVMQGVKPTIQPVQIAPQDAQKIQTIESQIKLINGQISQSERKLSDMGSDYPQRQKEIRAEIAKMKESLRSWQAKLDKAMAEAETNKNPVKAFNEFTMFIAIFRRIIFEGICWCLLLWRSQIGVEQEKFSIKFVEKKQPLSNNLQATKPLQGIENLPQIELQRTESEKKLIAAITEGKTERIKLQQTIFRGASGELDEAIKSLVASGIIERKNGNGKTRESYSLIN